MRPYESLLAQILDTGMRTANRTGIDTLSMFGGQVRYDLAAGFPLITSKRVPFRWVAEELFWFLSGSTNERDLAARGVDIWKEWAGPDGELGPTYGRQFRRVVYDQWVTPALFQPEPAPAPPFSAETTADTVGNTSLLGRRFESDSGPYTVIREVGENRKRFVVKFERTHAEREVSYNDVTTGACDLWAPTVFGVGRYGDYDATDPDYNTLVNTWREMMRRCYHTKAKAYRSYGAKGVHVDPRWLTFAEFQRDAKRLIGWSLKKVHPEEYSIDKDILRASNRYSQNTCMWASHEEQSLNTSVATPFSARGPDGKRVLFRSFREAVKMGLNQSAVFRCLHGELHKHHGWSEFSYETRGNLVLRTRVIDQVKTLIAGIILDPNSRRHVISLWTPGAVDEAKLPPCHGVALQYLVHGEKLHCHMFQRSADCFLGLPWNIASYALLTHLVAAQTGLKPGELHISITDAHVYVNHLDQVREVILREYEDPRPLPTLAVAPGVRSIFDYTFEHLALTGYAPHAKLAGEVAV